MPHSSAKHSAFSSFHEGIDLALVDFRFHINSVSTLLLLDSIYSVASESTILSTPMASPAASSVGSCSEPASASTSIYRDAYHVTGPHDHMQDYDDDFDEYKSCLHYAPLP
jgi:hypothetical protein